jgi:hypothetical protein
MDGLPPRGGSPPSLYGPSLACSLPPLPAPFSDLDPLAPRRRNASAVACWPRSRKRCRRCDSTRGWHSPPALATHAVSSNKRTSARRACPPPRTFVHSDCASRRKASTRYGARWQPCEVSPTCFPALLLPVATRHSPHLCPTWCGREAVTGLRSPTPVHGTIDPRTMYRPF